MIAPAMPIEPAYHPRQLFLVTGAAGFIGSHLCERLLAEGHRVLGVDNFDPYYARALKEANTLFLRTHSRFQLLDEDLREVDLHRLLGEVDGVFHLAGQPGVRGSWGGGFDGHLDANVRVTQRLLEALTLQSVPTVCASSSSVYGSNRREQLSETHPLAPRSPYGLSKLAGEQLVEVYRREYDVPVVSLRYFTVFGPRQRPDMAFQRFIGAALAGEALTLLGDGNQSRDFTFVDDVVSATIAALGAPSPVYNVGGGSPATINDVLDVIAELTAQRLVVQRGPVARGDVSHTWADTTLAREELDWAPKTDLYPGLAVQIDHCVRLASGRRLPQVAHREQGGP